MKTASYPTRTCDRSWVVWCFVGIIIAFAFNAFFPYWIDDLHQRPRREVVNECSALESAVISYYVEYNAMPDTSNNAVLIETLAGGIDPRTGKPVVVPGNRRGITFLSVRADQCNDKGEMVDPWGTPFRVTVDADHHVEVRSAGPDQVFDTADDFVVSDVSSRNKYPHLGP